MKVTNFICTGTRERGPLLGKIIIIILSFSVGTSKNKTIDHRVKESCAIMSTQVTRLFTVIQQYLVH